MYYEGQWIPVSKESLKSTATQNTICRELKCGQAFKIIDYFGLNQASHSISEIQCQHNGGDTVKDCNINVTTNSVALSSLGGLQCSSMFSIDLTT